MSDAFFPYFPVLSHLVLSSHAKRQWIAYRQCTVTGNCYDEASGAVSNLGNGRVSARGCGLEAVLFYLELIDDGGYDQIRGIDDDFLSDHTPFVVAPPTDDQLKLLKEGYTNVCRRLIYVHNEAHTGAYVDAARDAGFQLMITIKDDENPAHNKFIIWTKDLDHAYKTGNMAAKEQLFDLYGEHWYFCKCKKADCK